MNSISNYLQIHSSYPFDRLQYPRFSRHLQFLDKKGLLTPENIFNFQNHAEFNSLNIIIEQLYYNDLLNQENFDRARNHENINSLARALDQLHQNYIDTPLFRYNLMIHEENPHAFPYDRLHSNPILTQDSLNVLFSHLEPHYLSIGMWTLFTHNLYTPENFLCVAMAHNPESIANAIVILLNNAPNNSRYLNLLHTVRNPSLLAEAINQLSRFDLVTPRILNSIREHRNALELAHAIIALFLNNLLINQNFEAIIRHQAPSLLAQRLIAQRLIELNRNEFLDGENRFRLAHQHRIAIFNIEEEPQEVPFAMLDALLSPNTSSAAGG